MGRPEDTAAGGGIGDRLTPLEIASGLVLPAPRQEADRRGWPASDGRGASTGRGGSDGRGSSDGRELTSPREALERAIIPGLRRPPCLVSFSGGLDSAAVLATATALARREGLPLPIPATNVFPTVAEADESSWQELVIRELGLPDWIRIEHEDELDLIGPYAQRVLARHGLLWPANVHFHLPLLEAVPGGAMLTGVGGDELYIAAMRQHPAAVLSGAVRPRVRDALSLGLAFAPQIVRRPVIARRAAVSLPWLRPDAQRRVTALLVAEAAAEPRRLGTRLAWWNKVRYLQTAVRSLSLIADDTETLMLHPLLAPQFWKAVRGAAAPVGFATRGEGVRRLFGDLLPEALIERSSKANFGQAFWTQRAREFARAWDGTGVPLEWVNTRELAREWASATPYLPASTLLQAAWLASAGHRGEQPLEPILH
jgi:Asparagine synthase